MKSIRSRLFLWLVGIVICSILLLLILNSFFFKRYYLTIKEQDLSKAFTLITRIKTRSPQNLTEKLKPIEEKYGIEIIIHDRNRNILYSTNKHMPPFLRRPPEVKTIRSKKIPGGPLILLERDSIIKMTGLAAIGELDDIYKVIIHLHLSEMNMTISILNRFSLLTGTILLLLVIICSYYISGHLSAPIKEISRITQKMAKLDFSEKVEIEGEDETCTLAKNVNTLSDSLQKAIDELNEKNRQLARDIKEKNRLDEKRRELLRNVSHELKTPIALIMGYSEALNINLSDDEKKREFYSAMVVDEAHKMNDLVEKLLNIHQIEFGDIKLKLERTDLGDLINEIYKKYDILFKEKAITATINDRSKGTIYADQLMLESVCTNFLNNSISYIDGEKSIEIVLENIEDKIRVNFFNTASPLGEGELEKIWDSFYKVEKSRSKTKGNYGLGLSIVKAILDAHGYTYGVENTHKGILFWFDADRMV